MVEQIKGIQRTGVDAKLAWWHHCDTLLGGVRDPNCHDEHVLRAFLKQYNSGALARPAGGYKGGWRAPRQPRDLVRLIKEGQRRSKSWREAWQKYCAAHASGSCDPARVSDAILVGFLDFAGQAASGELGTQAEQDGGEGGEQADLVLKVKEVQRSGREAMTAWWTYCDESLAGVRDPNRHDAAALSTFLASRGVS
uniref:Uncharacterized protein n=1 Tax=Zooxanthella nutricula TaxID=1333877 RepID=A0A7S2KC70_9DINO